MKQTKIKLTYLTILKICAERLRLIVFAPRARAYISDAVTG